MDTWCLMEKNETGGGWQERRKDKMLGVAETKEGSWPNFILGKVIAKLPFFFHPVLTTFHNSALFSKKY